MIALLLPVVALLGWSIAGWALAALLWLGLHALDLLVIRARSKPGSHSGELRHPGVRAPVQADRPADRALRGARRDRNLALTTLLTYGLAYTFELGLSLASYFGTQSA